MLNLSVNFWKRLNSRKTKRSKIGETSKATNLYLYLYRYACTVFLTQINTNTVRNKNLYYWARWLISLGYGSKYSLASDPRFPLTTKPGVGKNCHRIMHVTCFFRERFTNALADTTKVLFEFRSDPDKLQSAKNGEGSTCWAWWVRWWCQSWTSPGPQGCPPPARSTYRPPSATGIRQHYKKGICTYSSKWRILSRRNEPNPTYTEYNLLLLFGCRFTESRSVSNLLVASLRIQIHVFKTKETKKFYSSAKRYRYIVHYHS